LAHAILFVGDSLAGIRPNRIIANVVRIRNRKCRLPALALENLRHRG
jgi:hypothetical protein